MNCKYEIIDSGLAVEDPGRYSSIGVDDNGVVHVSYYDYHAATDNGNLKYAARDTAGNWTINVIDSTGNVGMYSSLALHNGNVYITYGDSDHNYIKLSSNETFAWKSDVVAKNILSATYSRLVIQDNGVKHFSYFSNCGGDPSIDLCYGAIGLATSIGLVVDDSGIGNGEQSSLALDEDGQAHIVYYDIQDRDLKYARQIN